MSLVKDYIQRVKINTADEGSSEAFDGSESDEEEEKEGEYKDITEIELEKAVFGDNAGFHERLRDHRVARNNRGPAVTARGPVEDEVEDDIRDIEDADVCYVVAFIVL